MARNHNTGGGKYSIRTRSAEKNISSDQGGASSSVVGASTRVCGAARSSTSAWQTMCIRGFRSKISSTCVQCAKSGTTSLASVWLSRSGYTSPISCCYMAGELEHGVLSYNARKKSWDWYREWSYDDLGYAAAEDVVFSIEKSRLEIMEAGQFDWKWWGYKKLELPPIPLDRGKWILGIMSCGDAEEGCAPYKGDPAEGNECCAPYKVVCARQGFNTHVYDSERGDW